MCVFVYVYVCWFSMENYGVGRDIYTEWRISDFSTVMRKIEKHPFMHQHAKIEKERTTVKNKWYLKWCIHWSQNEMTERILIRKRGIKGWNAHERDERRSNDILIGGKNKKSEHPFSLILIDFHWKWLHFMRIDKIITILFTEWIKFE